MKILVLTFLERSNFKAFFWKKKRGPERVNIMKKASPLYCQEKAKVKVKAFQ